MTKYFRSLKETYVQEFQATVLQNQMKADLVVQHSVFFIIINIWILVCIVPGSCLACLACLV